MLTQAACVCVLQQQQGRGGGASSTEGFQRQRVCRALCARAVIHACGDRTPRAASALSTGGWAVGGAHAPPPSRARVHARHVRCCCRCMGAHAGPCLRVAVCACGCGVGGASGAACGAAAWLVKHDEGLVMVVRGHTDAVVATPPPAILRQPCVLDAGTTRAPVSIHLATACITDTTTLVRRRASLLVVGCRARACAAGRAYARMCVRACACARVPGCSRRVGSSNVSRVDRACSPRQRLSFRSCRAVGCLRARAVDCLLACVLACSSCAAQRRSPAVCARLCAPSRRVHAALQCCCLATPFVC